jgi:starch synthase
MCRFLGTKFAVENENNINMSDKKMKIHFVSMECYPMAKVGGLADVVGSLPKYLNRQNCEVEVFMPRYSMPWFEGKKFREGYSSWYELPSEHIGYRIGKLMEHDSLGFQLNIVDIPGKLDRTGVYSDREGRYFGDEAERHIAFQRAYLYYILLSGDRPDIIHCHDHHTGLIPFMIKYCPEYKALAGIPTVFTIHNERYQGAFGWSKQYLLPYFDPGYGGMIEWAQIINPLASAIKCAWKVTTVSESYMEELRYNSFGLEWLFNNEYSKCKGILNGIDTETWDPDTDKYLAYQNEGDFFQFKWQNKQFLLNGSQVNKDMPLVAFISRFAGEKGADLIPAIIENVLNAGLDFNFVILGTGDKWVENRITEMAAAAPDRILAKIAYNEKVSHQIYAASDFLIMPSRVEPCGLNQMYAMRYGTIPLVNNIGGLRDSVQLYNGETGTGFRFQSLSIPDILIQLKRAQDLYWNREHFDRIRTNAYAADFSWDKSAVKYESMYKSLL